MATSQFSAKDRFERGESRAQVRLILQL